MMFENIGQKHVYDEFQYNCETNDQNVSVIEVSQLKMIEMFQRKKTGLIIMMLYF